MINLKSPVLILKILIGMVIAGFLLGIENSQQVGCIVDLGFFSIPNYLLTATSIVILSRALKSKNKSVILTLTGIELGIWILKFLFFKGGYIVGFGGGINPINAVYDFTAIALRVYLVLLVASKSKNVVLFALLTSLIFVLLKILFFAYPLVVDSRSNGSRKK